MSRADKSLLPEHIHDEACSNLTTTSTTPGQNLRKSPIDQQPIVHECSMPAQLIKILYALTRSSGTQIYQVCIVNIMVEAAGDDIRFECIGKVARSNPRPWYVEVSLINVHGGRVVRIGKAILDGKRKGKKGRSGRHPARPVPDS